MYLQLIIAVLFVTVINADLASNYTRAEPCDPIKCILPKCRCSDIKLNETIPVEKIPQLVTVTFDDAITTGNFDQFQEIFSGLVNPDKCKAKATFFVSHEYTDYSKVHELWAQGNEIALHSITHGPNTTYWKTASVELIMKEFGEQIQIIEHFANMNGSDIKGIRLPFFEMSGNNSYIAIRELGLKYDSSWPTQHFTKPGMWPYTLDYLSSQDCPMGFCPDAAVPGVWINPLINWEDTQGYKCAMVDACAYMPEDTVPDLVNWMIENFNRTYYGNRAPFGVYLHASFFTKGENYFAAFKAFMKYLNSKPDVYLTTTSKVLEYVENPTGKFNSCPTIHKPNCKSRLCQVIRKDTNEERWMTSCQPCPAVYPWLGNPLGLAKTNHSSNGNRTTTQPFF